MGSLDLKSHYSDILKENGIFDEILQVQAHEPTNLAGEHFGSRCEYVTVSFKDKSIPDAHFFVKLPLVDEENTEVYAKLMLKEVEYLTHFLSHMEEFCREKLGEENGLLKDIFPRTFYADKDEIVMENMTNRGFSMKNKSIRQDFHQASLVLVRLAHIHAISKILIEKAGSKEVFLEKYPMMFDNNFHPEIKHILSVIFGPAYVLVFKIIEESDVEGADAAFAKLGKYTGKEDLNIMDIFRNTLSAKSVFDCVNHGDCWNNNMMFSEHPDSVTLFDFQMSRIASPSPDLSYYLFTSTRIEVLREWKSLLQIYYEEFKVTSQRLGHPIDFTYEELLKDFSVKAEFGFLIGLFQSIGSEAMQAKDVDKTGMDQSQFTTLLSDYIKEKKEYLNEPVTRMVEMINIFENIKNLV